ncbi:Fic family protein [Lichenicola sp.]|uniref:Fic family protein n=1 Tax=Lichenicola sp. TaxID=2804529 RepID=UPI003AFF9717
MQINADAGLLQLPRSLALSAALAPLEQAVDACSTLRARLRTVPYRDSLMRAESRLDALALALPQPSAARHELPGGFGGTASDNLLRLLVLEASEDRAAPRSLRPSVNGVAAFELGLQRVRANGTGALTAGLLQDLHRLLFLGLGESGSTSAGIALSDGRRREPGWSGDGQVPSRVQPGAGLQDLERFLLDPPRLPLPVRMALVVAKVECLSSFDQGSRQLAWLLMPLMTAAENRPPLFVAQTLAARREHYETALAGLRSTGDWEAWVGFFLQRLAEAADGATARLDRTEGLQRARAADLFSLRSDSTARRLAELALGVPVLTVGAAQTMLGVSFQTANAAVATLQRLGIVTPHSSNRRNRIFIVSGTLATLTGGSWAPTGFADLAAAGAEAI